LALIARQRADCLPECLAIIPDKVVRVEQQREVTSISLAALATAVVVSVGLWRVPEETVGLQYLGARGWEHRVQMLLILRARALPVQALAAAVVAVAPAQAALVALAS
jgi:hypothetical protein